MAATEQEGADLHREFCKFLLDRLREVDPETKVPVCTASWGAVIRAFLKDNSITTVPDPAGAGDLAALSREFHNSSPPRRMDPNLDLGDEVH